MQSGGMTGTECISHTCGTRCPTCSATNSTVVLPRQPTSESKLVTDAVVLFISSGFPWFKWWPEQKQLKRDSDFFSIDEKEINRCRGPPALHYCHFESWQLTLEFRQG